MGGGALGLLAGDWLVRDTDFSVGQSVILDLSVLSGALLGAGTAYLAAKQGQGPYLLASAMGGAAGFALSYWAYHDVPDSRASARLSHLGGGGAVVIPTAGPGGERGLAVGGRF
jgi:hypothetical protein